MALSVNITSFTKTETGFEATGDVGGKTFTSRTVKYSGDLIFKIVEPNDDGELVLKTMADSEFGRGDRNAVARFLKKVREDFEKDEVLSVEELSGKTIKELRTIAKNRGISGYYAKGVDKDALVAMLTPVADTVEVDEAPEVEIEIDVTDVADEASVTV